MRAWQRTRLGSEICPPEWMVFAVEASQSASAAAENNRRGARKEQRVAAVEARSQKSGAGSM